MADSSKLFGIVAGYEVNCRFFDLDDGAAEATGSLRSRLMAVAMSQIIWLL